MILTVHLDDHMRRKVADVNGGDELCCSLFSIGRPTQPRDVLSGSGSWCCTVVTYEIADCMAASQDDGFLPVSMRR